MEKTIKRSFNRRKRRQSAEFRPGNMAAFMHGGSRKKQKKRVKGK